MARAHSLTAVGQGNGSLFIRYVFLFAIALIVGIGKGLKTLQIQWVQRRCLGQFVNGVIQTVRVQMVTPLFKMLLGLLLDGGNVVRV